MQFVSPKNSAVVSDEFIDTESDATIDSESYQPYSPEEASESDQSSDTSQQLNKSVENNFLNEPKCLVFWSSLLLLFCYCFTFKEKTKITSVKTRGTLLVVTMKCHNKHIHTWQSQPMVNNTGAGNIFFYLGMKLYTGNTFKRISEMFDSINIAHFSRAL